MRRLRSWLLPLCYLGPALWFIYISVDLLAEQSSSRRAIELAHEQHLQHNHHHDQQSPRQTPETTMDEARRRDALQAVLAEIIHQGDPGHAGVLSQKDRAALSDPEFQAKLRRYLEHQGLLKKGPEQGVETKAQPMVPDVGGAGGRRGNKVDRGHRKGGGGNAAVQFPPYVEEWGPQLPGEGGKAVNTNVSQLSSEEKLLYDQGWRHNSFNQYASDMISVHRSLPDDNSPECVEQRKEYSTQLPEVSVIIIFHNEAWSVLLRSVHSVISRTPAHLLRQIILVDDLSTMGHLKKPLEVYWEQEPKVQIVRAPSRVGLTQARILGYRQATAEVLLFLDSHIECFPGWIEPLLDRIVRHPGAVTYPNIEIINDTTLGVGITIAGSRAIFRWKDLTFQWEFIPLYEKNRRKNVADLIRSPTMPGGLFAINRQFFQKLGTYDPGLEYWGGENIELSFKAWMCNGSVEMIPCSHVGHIYRRSNPIKWSTNIGNKNSIRVAEVWMDDYKNYFYERFNYNMGNFGDVTERKRLRESLGCHNFDWYLKNVFPNLEIPRDVQYAGEVRNVASSKCLDTMGDVTKPPSLSHCHNLGGNQFWYFTNEGDLHQDGNHICEKDGGLSQNGPCLTGLWTYNKDRTLLHVQTGRCLAGSPGSDTLNLQVCSDSALQQWTMTTRPADRVFP